MKLRLSLILVILCAAAAVPAQGAKDAAELTRLLNDFLAGAGRGDAAVHERFWADDLIYTRASGVRTNKAEIMKGVRDAKPAKPEDPKTVYTAEDIRIQQYGDTAVVAFKLVGATTDAAGRVTTSRFYNTGLFVKRKGEWRAVAWQATKMAESA